MIHGIGGKFDGTEKQSDFPWGACPECGQLHHIVPLGKELWAVCDAHGLRWLVGDNPPPDNLMRPGEPEYQRALKKYKVTPRIYWRYEVRTKTCGWW